ncbi:unnamed protein product [Closterium sp. NIES-54]
MPSLSSSAAAVSARCFLGGPEASLSPFPSSLSHTPAFPLSSLSPFSIQTNSAGAQLLYQLAASWVGLGPPPPCPPPVLPPLLTKKQQQGQQELQEQEQQQGQEQQGQEQGQQQQRGQEQQQQQQQEQEQEQQQQARQGGQGDEKNSVLVFDVCCGTGTIGLCVAKHAKKVIGIEMNESAVEDAKRNAAINGIQHAEFIASRAELVLPKLLHKYLPQVKPASDGLPKGKEEKEGQQPGDGKEEGKEEAKEEGKKEFEFSRVVTIVDPPRAGLHPTVLRALRENPKIEQLLYISCNPTSLVANVLDLCSPPPELKKPQAGGGGWSKWGPAAGQRAMAGEPFRPVRAVAVDLFPHTEHCEVVMLLER